MGHTRLGELPKTRRWNEVVRLLGTSDFTPQELGRIAAKTMAAARAALSEAIDDPGLQHSFFLLTQIAVAGKSDKWQSALGQVGIDAYGTNNVFELSCRLHAAVDSYVGRRSSDFSEVAQRAAGEALLQVAGGQTPSLFGTESEELTETLRAVSTKKGFSELGHKFFSNFVARFLNSYLSRATAEQLGKGALRQLGDVSQFDEAFRQHCDQTARIVKDFCGDWYSKTVYTSEINPETTSRFVAVAFKKLQAELKRQKAGA